MGGRHVPLLLWALAAGLWTLVFVDRCIGGDVGVVAVAHETVAAPDDGDAAAPARTTAAPENAQTFPGGGCIDINRAGAKELETLPGIGPAIAGRIIEYRSGKGRFSKLADLDAVKGIGPATLRKLEGRVCF